LGHRVMSWALFLGELPRPPIRPWDLALQTLQTLGQTFHYQVILLPSPSRPTFAHRHLSTSSGLHSHYRQYSSTIPDHYLSATPLPSRSFS
jgi:hypothetical protein